MNYHAWQREEKEKLVLVVKQAETDQLRDKE
jgi:hypothetical protein